MAESDKASERSTLILQLGRLLAPIHNLAEKPTPPTSTEYQVAAAKFKPDLDRWRAEAHQFTIVGDVTFGHELDDIIRGPRDIFGSLATLARDARTEPEAKQSKLQTILKQCEKATITAIDQVPIEWAPRLLEEQTPFNTYLKIRDAIGTARKRIHYFDRYLDSDFYSLYLRDIDPSLEIRLITTKGNRNYGVISVLAVSRLAAQEFPNYQLVECDPSNMHDRNLRIDDTIFFLGTSAKDAGRYPTNFSPSDSTSNGHSILDKILAKGMAVT
jgi:hypothetical protein